MSSTPNLDELRELHRRCTYSVIQQLFVGPSTPMGWSLHVQKNGAPGTDGLRSEDLQYFFAGHDGSPHAVSLALSTLAKRYLVDGGAVRSELAAAKKPLPRALILVAPPHTLVDGEVVKTFVLTEHQLFLADSPVSNGGKEVRLADLELVPASLTHNDRPFNLN